MNKTVLRKQELEKIVLDFMATSPNSRIPAEGVYTQGIGGTPIFGEPVFAYGRADDPLFEMLKDISVVGAHHRSPLWWLPTAESVISLFFPFSQEVIEANAQDASWPADAWYRGRIDGQRFLLEAAFHLADALTKAGYACVIPDSRELPERAETRFKAGASIRTPEQTFRLSFTSNWSERHVAYVCGLGTFSLSRSMITARGCAGRFCNIVTELKIEPTPRPYSDPYEYCTSCGACISRCPVSAISLEEGKDQAKCRAFLNETRQNPPYYGCGKCQTGVPCASNIPGKRA